MARNQSEQEPIAEGVSDQLAEVIRTDARAGEFASDNGHGKFADLSDADQKLYQYWDFDKKRAFYKRYKAWLKSQSS